MLSCQLSFEGLAAPALQDSMRSNEEMPEGDFWIMQPENLEVQKKVEIPLSGLWKGAALIPEEGLIALGGLTEIALYKWPELTHVHTDLLSHEKSIMRLTYNPLLKKLISCSSDGTVKLWKVLKSKLNLWKTYEHPGPVFSVEVLEDKQSIAVAGEFPSIYLWDMLHDTTEIIHCNFGTPIFCMKYIQEADQLAVTNSYEGAIYIYNMLDNSCQYKIENAHAKEKPIWFLAYYEPKRLLYSAGSDGVINVWQEQSTGYKFKRKIRNTKNNVVDLFINCPNGKLVTLAMSEKESQVSVWGQRKHPCFEGPPLPEFNSRSACSRLLSEGATTSRQRFLMECAHW